MEKFNKDNTKELIMTMQVYDIAKVKTPLEKYGISNYHGSICGDDLLNLFDNWLVINPRVPNEKNGNRVAKGIIDTIKNAPDKFVVRNGGLLLLAESIKINNNRFVNSKNIDVELKFTDILHQGLADGGHTYSKLKMLKNKGNKLDNVYVKFEIITGLSDVESVETSVSRNIRIAVKDSSIANSRGYFEPLKKMIEGKPYAKYIEYKANASQLMDDSSIPIEDVYSYLKCVNLYQYPVDDISKQPANAYVRSSDVIVELSSDEVRRKFGLVISITDDIMRLRDIIHRDMPILYENHEFVKSDGSKEHRLFKDVLIKSNVEDGVITNEVLKSICSIDDEEKLTNPAVEHKKAKKENTAKKQYPLYTLGIKSDYRLSKAMIMPILSAFRQLIALDDDGREYFAINPFDFWNYCGETITVFLCELYSTYSGPTYMGRKSATFMQVFTLVSTLLMQYKSELLSKSNRVINE